MKKVTWAISELIWLGLIVVSFGVVWIIKEIIARGVRDGMRSN